MMICCTIVKSKCCIYSFHLKKSPFDISLSLSKQWFCHIEHVIALSKFVTVQI